MGIPDRRAREREQRKASILEAAWRVADSGGWAAFSVERVAADAELGRATVYGYFESLEALVLAMAHAAFDELSSRTAATTTLPESLDVPVRFAKDRRAAFALLFPTAPDPREAFSNAELEAVRAEARQLIGRLRRLADKAPALPEDARAAEAFLSAISMAATLVPELSNSTTLRRKWQDFALGDRAREEAAKEPDSDDPDGDVEKQR